ncbi:hypothetical protein BSKO_03820 [Bryopsis sp. KO-2023]|nr:hypothetical protein BSKO_03820 [Bryopsis sp. KO-2023]
MTPAMHAQCGGVRALVARPSQARRIGRFARFSRFGGAVEPTPKLCKRALLHKRLGFACRASEQEEGDADNKNMELISTVGTFGLYFAFVGYNLFLAPNQTPYQDQYVVQKLLKLVDDEFVVNRVLVDLFQAFPIITALYASVLIPSARSANKIPAWPFVSVSFALGGFALFPYFALWKPDASVKSPPGPEELEGLSGIGLKVSESKFLGIFLALAAVYYIGDAALAGGDSWKEFYSLAISSRFVHATTIDFTALNLLLPFWLSVDASKRSWGKDKETLVNILSYIPLVGPSIYLAIRPRTESQA